MATAIQKKITGFDVVKPGAVKPTAAGGDEAFRPEADRRLRLEAVPTPLADSLRWQKRPVLPEGNASWTYVVDSPEGRFAMDIGHVTNGHDEPFEVWVKGDDAPRGLKPLAKSISMDMRSQDRGWLVKKLEALAKVECEAFEMMMPDGVIYRMPSAVAAFARLVAYRCGKLGALQSGGPTPILDALASKREPKTLATGAVTWSVDVENPATGDDFLMTLKEAVYPDGSRRPFSLWMAGKYPKSLDGLCKSLSLDMRVVDVAWGLRKLKQLSSVVEENGGLFAQVPGSEKSSYFTSTVAYIAALILHRYKVLGLTDEFGNAAGNTVVVSIEAARGEGEQHAPKGESCKSCGAVGTIRHDGGCATCSVCGDSHCS